MLEAQAIDSGGLEQVPTVCQAVLSVKKRPWVNIKVRGQRQAR